MAKRQEGKDEQKEPVALELRSVENLAQVPYLKTRIS
jgi:hypothetical protein